MGPGRAGGAWRPPDRGVGEEHLSRKDLSASPWNEAGSGNIEGKFRDTES